MPVFHSAYGLSLSASSALPGLAIRPESAVKTDVWIRLKQPKTPFGGLPFIPSELIYESPNHNGDPQAKPAVTVEILAGGEYFGFTYRDGARFAVERTGREVWADWPDDYTFEDAATYLMGPILGFVLRLHGITPLHASAVAVDDQAIALVGPPGAGKSTTAAAFARLGYPVLSDDISALDDRQHCFLVQPGYPRVNLWPDSAEALFGSQDALPCVTPTWEKRFLALNQNGYHFETQSLPLAAIYILNDRDPSLADPVFEELAGWPALQALVGNTYVNYLLDRDMRQREFDVLSRLVKRVPIRRVRPAADSSRLFHLCEGIAADVKTLAASALVATAPGHS